MDLEQSFREALDSNYHFILESLLDNAPVIIGVKDSDGRYLLVNKEYQRLFDLREEDMLGKTDFEVFPPEVAQPFVDADRRVFELEEPVYFEETAPIHGEPQYFLSIKFPIRNEAGEVFALGLVATNITPRRQMEQELHKTEKALFAKNAELHSALDKMQQMAVIDQLTGAWNRYKFEEVAMTEIGRFHRYRSPLSMAMIDLDGFKRVNDEIGHDVGDHVLKTFVDLLQRSIREVDYLFRWGGDEFILLMPSTMQGLALSVAEKLREAVADSELARSYQISASFSVAMIGPTEGLQEWLVRVDQGLYKAKEEGKDRVYSCPETSERFPRQAL